MSLHAQLSPEAQAALEAQQRNSTISSVAIAVLSILLVGLALFYILLPSFVKEDVQVVAYNAPAMREDRPDEPRLQQNIQRKPSAPSANTARAIASRSPSKVAIPVPEIDNPNPSLEIGDGADFGSGWGDGDGPGGGFKQVPETMRKRCSEVDRLARLKEMGGTPECEDAVVRGLRWLKSTQHQSGQWPGRMANTGFALLAYLGYCKTPIDEEFGDSCLRAIIYLVDVGMRTNGKLTGNDKDKSWSYEHAINTYALAEAYTFSRKLEINIPNLDTVVQKAGQLIIDNQTKEGGWEYAYAEVSNRGGGDLSIAAWQLQALKACSYTGLDFRNLKKAADRGVAYVASLAGPDGAFGYSRPGQHHTDYGTLTGAGVLSMQLWGRGSAKEVRNGAKYIEKNTKFDFDTRYADLYGHYYEAQAMMNRGGEQWRKYNALFRDQLLKNQNPDGSWKAPNSGKELRAVAAT
ncbi:MAG: hypothetical protein MUF04_10100, partial [Akkermansiaceae bacterium]|nr:hypothetical protein [Akkermansiaceae bacterium]